MNLEEIVNEYDKEMVEDCKITSFNCLDKQMMLPAIKHKWVGRIVRLKVDIENLKSKKNEIKNRLMEKKKSENPINFSDAIVEKQIAKLDAIIKIESDIKSSTILLSYLSDCHAILASMTYDFNNISKLIAMEQE